MNVNNTNTPPTDIFGFPIGPAAPLTFAGFVANVETFQTTIDGTDAGAIFDMSSSEITGNTFINANSTQDVTFNSVNMTAGGTNGDDNGDGQPDDLFSLELFNVTNNADTTVTTRPAQVSGPTDAANILATNIDSNAIIGDVNFFGAPNTTSASGIETFNLSTAGSPQMVSIEDLNTPGATTLNIAADSTGLIIGDPDADVGISGTVGDRQIVNFDNHLSSTINVVDGSTSTGGFGVSVEDAINDVTVTGGAGDDTVEGSDNNDSISGNGGADLLDGDSGNDTLNGGEGNDTLLGRDGADVIFGDGGNDVIDGGDGNDVLNGGDGNDTIHTGNSAADEIVDGGSGIDNVTTNVQHLDGTDENGIPLNLVDQLSGGAGSGDTLFLEGTASIDINGLNFVQQFENIELGGSGVQNFVIGNGSVFETDHDARVAAGNADGSTTIDGTSAGNSVLVDATTLNEAITLIGGDGNDVLRGGRGNDLIIGDGDLSGSGGNDVLEGGQGDDTFRMGENQLDGSDAIEGDQGSDTIEIANRSNGTAATIGAGVAGLELVKVLDDVGSQGQSFDLSFVAFDNNDNINLLHDGASGNQNGPRLHVDGSELDLGEELNVNMSTNTFDEDIQITGGGGDDTFNMGLWFDSGDLIDGGADSGNSDTLIVDIAMAGGLNDDDFANTSNVETLVLVDPSNSGATVNLGALAAAAGIKTVDASALTVGGTTINATAFPNDLTVIDSNADLNINTGGGNDTIVLAGGTDNINTDGGADRRLLSPAAIWM